jgi:hypothetical protein
LIVRNPLYEIGLQNIKHLKILQEETENLFLTKLLNQQVKTALELLKKNEQLTMNELAFDMKQKYPTFDITPQHLGQVIRDNNQTIKRTTHEHFPKERYKKPIDKQTEMNYFYQK